MVMHHCFACRHLHILMQEGLWAQMLDLGSQVREFLPLQACVIWMGCQAVHLACLSPGFTLQVLACKLRVEELRQAVAGQLATAVITSAEGAGSPIDDVAAAARSQSGGGVQEPSCAALPEMGALLEQSDCAGHGGCKQTAAPACMPQSSCGVPPTESAAVAARPRHCRETLVWAGSLEAEGANQRRLDTYQLQQSEIRQQDVRTACEMATTRFKVSSEYTPGSPDSVLALI